MAPPLLNFEFENLVGLPSSEIDLEMSSARHSEIYVWRSLIAI